MGKNTINLIQQVALIAISTILKELVLKPKQDFKECEEIHYHYYPRYIYREFWVRGQVVRSDVLPYR